MEEKKKKASIMIKELKKLFPKAETALHHTSAWELLVATILSAQCTDKLVNKVTEQLFQKYKTLDDYLKVSVEDFDQDIKSVTFHSAKAKNILATVKLVKEKYGGNVPDTMEDLTSLPGAARKTANVVLGVWFHKNVGVVVDTHVRRLAQLHGLTVNEDPVKIEKDLMEILPQDEWTDFSLRLILYGRQYCTGRPHDHANCPLVTAGA
jgi:endonuclease-3